METITCTWCKTVYTQRTTTNCINCGGPLPAPPGPDRGVAPSNPPRKIPEKFKKDVMLWKNLTRLIGLIFLIIGIPLIAAFGIGLIFTIVGYFLYKHGTKVGLNRIKVLEQGKIAEGEILTITVDHSQTMNNRHPFKVSYKFSNEFYQGVGETIVWDTTVQLWETGNKVWVVYLEGQEVLSSIWPPMA